MTANDTTQNPIQFKEFTAFKQADFFENLKQPRFSGQLLLTGPKQRKWVFYLYLGRIIYATGGMHPVRRWRRNIAGTFPHLPTHIGALQEEISNLPLHQSKTCWEYELLCLWVDQQKISIDQAAKMIRSTIVEVLFDLTQIMQVTCQLKSDNGLSTKLGVLIDSEQVISEAKKLWQAWQLAKIADRSPDMAPVITQPEELQQHTSAQIYQTLSQLLDGQQTLRDLSVRMKRDVLTVTRSLLPYVQSGLVKLIEIPDLQSPVPPDDPEVVTTTVTHKPLIACVDDSPLICQTMEKILTEGGYNFLGVNDPLRAIAILLSRKPDLIFLDLIMPNANGYEICGQLRKLSFFRYTPIVILTGNDGLIDRMRAKMIGSSDFVSKPINSEIVLETIRKHLKYEPVE